MLKEYVRFLIPYIPIFGIFIILFSSASSWIHRDKYGDLDTPIGFDKHPFICLSSAIAQVIFLVWIFDLFIK